MADLPITSDEGGQPVVINDPITTANVANVTTAGALKVDGSAVTQPTSETNVDKNFGTWSYYAGSSGTVVVSAGQRVIGIGVHATTAGSFTINGGASIPIPANVGISIEPLGNIIAPTIIFTGTDSYMVEVVQ
jgi:hypothetical protein